MRSFFLTVFLFSILTSFADNWPRFRGPNGAGVSADPIPVHWKANHFKWKTPLPGVGHGSPVVWNDKVFLLCADEDTGERTAVAVDATNGRVLWKAPFKAEKHKYHKQNSFASSTPDVAENSI